MCPENVFSSAMYSSAVPLLPDIAPDMDLFEEGARFDLGRLIRDLLRRRRWPLARAALADRVIHLLDLGEEGIEAGGERVPGAPERQVPAESQEAVRLAVADRGIFPCMIPTMSPPSTRLWRCSGQTPLDAWSASESALLGLRKGRGFLTGRRVEHNDP